MPTRRAKPQKVDRNVDEESNSSISTENRSMLDIFKESEDLHAHERLVVDLKVNFFDKLHLDEFNSDLFLCLRFLFLLDDRLRTEKPFTFVVKFIMYCFKDQNMQKRNEKLFRKLIHFIHWHRCANEPLVRFHVVQLLKILLSLINDEIELSDSIYEEMQRLVISRLWDNKIYIRAEAASASSRLQDPENAKCPIVIGLMHLSRYDSSHTVRLAAIQSLAITTKTLPCILYRCYDINDSIRKKAYELLTKWKILKPLTISKRLQLIESGLNDKVKSVQNACINLIKTWFAVCGNDPVLLLKRLDVENSELQTKQAFLGLIKSMSEEEIISLVEYLKNMMDEKKLIKLDKLNGESAFLWRHLSSFLSANSNTYSEHLEQILPNMHDFEDYLKYLFLNPIRYEDSEDSAEVFSVLKQLLPILKLLDIFDEHNRKRTIELIQWALSSRNVPFNYVDDLMKLLVRLEKDNNKVCDMSVEIINELLYGENDGLCSTEDMSKATKCDEISEGPVSVACIDGGPTATVPRSDESMAEQAQATRERIRMKNIEIAQLQMRIMEVKEKIESQIQNDNIGDNDTIELMSELNNLKGQKRVAEEERQLLQDASCLQDKSKSTQQIISGSKQMDVDQTQTGENKGNNSGHQEEEEEEDEDTIREKERAKEEAWNKPGNEDIIMKACNITTAMIQSCTMLWNMPSSLRSLFNNVILVSVQHAHLLVRRSAFIAMGLCCLLDKDTTVKYYKVFMQGLQIDHDSIKEVAVESLVDFFLRFGIEPFQEAILLSKEHNNSVNDFSQSTISEESSINYSEEDYNKTTMELFNPIIALLNNKTIRSTVAVGLSKLIYNQKLISNKLLSRLLLLWFSPETADEYRLRSHIASLFNTFCLSSIENQQVAVSCFLPTLRSLMRASDDSPLSKIDITTVLTFFEKITDSRALIQNRLLVKKEDGKIVDAFKQEADDKNPCHDELALQVISQILRSPQSTESKHLMGMLTKLRLSKYKIRTKSNIDDEEKSNLENKSNDIDDIKTESVEIDPDEVTRNKLKEIHKQLGKLLNKIKDKKCGKEIEVMYDKLQEYINQDENNNYLQNDIENKQLENQTQSINTRETSLSSGTGDSVNPPTLLEIVDANNQPAYLGAKITGEGNTLSRTMIMDANMTQHRHLKSLRPGYALPATPAGIKDDSNENENSSSASSSTELVSEDLKNADSNDDSDSKSNDERSTSTIKKPSTPKKPRRDNNSLLSETSSIQNDDAVFKVPKSNIRLTRMSKKSTVTNQKPPTPKTTPSSPARSRSIPDRLRSTRNTPIAKPLLNKSKSNKTPKASDSSKNEQSRDDSEYLSNGQNESPNKDDSMSSSSNRVLRNRDSSLSDNRTPLSPRNKRVISPNSSSSSITQSPSSPLKRKITNDESNRSRSTRLNVRVTRSGSRLL